MEPHRLFTVTVTVTGDEVWIDYSAICLAGGLSISGRDVTAEVLLHAELERANAELDKLAASDPLTDLPNRRGVTPLSDPSSRVRSTELTTRLSVVVRR